MMDLCNMKIGILHRAEVSNIVSLLFGISICVLLQMMINENTCRRIAHSNRARDIPSKYISKCLFGTSVSHSEVERSL